MWGAAWRLIGGTFSALRDAMRRPAPHVIRRLKSPDDSFPDPRHTNPTGILAVGGELTTARLLDAYGRGIFPYYEGGPLIVWWSPDPRAVIELNGLHVSRRLARTVRGGKFRVTFDTAFAEVINACAVRDEGTWLNPDMIRAYTDLHHAGHAHSVEVWRGDDLAGGVYGITIGGVFAGESMFSRVSDGSKVALVHLVEHLRQRGYTLFDIQILNDHTARMGAVEIPRDAYLDRLADAVRLGVTFRDSVPRCLTDTSS